MDEKEKNAAVAAAADKKAKKKKIKGFFMMNLGIILMAAGVYFFKIPNGFSTGGVSGIGTLLGKLFPDVSAPIWITGINALLLIAGLIFLGKENMLRTAYCSMAYSLLTWLFERLFPLSAPLTDQTFMELVYAMLLTGVGSAMIFNESASSGGTDIIALILKKHTPLDTGKALFVTDSLIAVSSFFVFGTAAGLFSLLGLFAKAFLIDSVIESLNTCKYFVIITSRPEPITEFIIRDLHHGVTSGGVRGMFTGEDKTMLHTVCRRIEGVRLRRFIKETDPHAFMIVTSSSEIIGRGFRSV